MTTRYLLERIARHGQAVQRLADERHANSGAYANETELTALALDAADFVWTYLALKGGQDAQEGVDVRDSIADAILQTLTEVHWVRDE